MLGQLIAAPVDSDQPEPSEEYIVSTVDLRQLEYFACTAEAGSFAQAANRLFVAPQAVSKGVQHLEASIGSQLFERTANGIVLTEFGALFLHKAKEVL